MTRSEQIDELAAALSRAQGAMGGAKKDSENPFFDSKYADLASVWDACRKPLAENGLSVVQFPRLMHVSEDWWLVEVETTLLHTSGQFMSDVLAVPVTKVDAQGVGSAITYARRYALGAVAGVAPEDDDGNAAVGGSMRTSAPMPKVSRPLSAPKDDALRIVKVTEKPTAKGGLSYLVTFSDGQTFSTLSSTLYVACCDLKESGAVVERELQKNGQYTNLKGVRGKNMGALVDTDVASEPPPDTDDIPF